MGKISEHFHKAKQNIQNKYQEHKQQKAAEQAAYKKESNKAKIKRAEDRAWQEQGYHKTSSGEIKKAKKRSSRGQIGANQLSNIGAGFAKAGNDMFNIDNMFGTSAPRKKTRKVTHTTTTYY